MENCGQHLELSVSYDDALKIHKPSAIPLGSGVEMGANYNQLDPDDRIENKDEV